jgi:hypothetical protein
MPGTSCHLAKKLKSNIAAGDFRFDMLPNRLHIVCVMIAHAEPVEVWGVEPCGNLVFPIQSRCLAGTVAARRTRRAPGAAYSRSNVADQHLCFYGRRQSRRRKQRNIKNEHERSSPAAAPPVQPRLAFQASRRHWAGSILCCAFLVLVVRPGMSGDLENSRRRRQ